MYDMEKFSPEQIRQLLRAQQTQANAQQTQADAQMTQAGRSTPIDFDYGAGANQMAQTLAAEAGPQAAIARMLFDTTKRDPNPAVRASGVSQLQSALRSFIGRGGGGLGQDMAARQAAAPAPIQQARATGPGPFGSSQALLDPAEQLRQMRLQQIADAMQQAELRRINDNRGFAQSREGRSQGAYEMLMRLLPKFMGKI